jgi:uncharacterized protein (DUF2141 family)
MKFKRLLILLGSIFSFYFISYLGIGCAQIGSPTGGPRDSIPPVLVSAYPALQSTRFKDNKIVLTFNEYIDLQEIQANVLVSPFPKVNPNITFKLKTVTVKLKDTLKENTTYAINFGNAIRDNNEGNPFKNFTYVFSTGNTIDSLKLSGKVLLAETGKADSTISVVLYRNAHDTMVQTRKPDYLTKLDRDGNFTFTNLSEGHYKVYALKDGDGGKTYNSKIEVFAFNDTEIFVVDSTKPINLFAYAEEKDKKPAGTASTTAKAAADKKLKYTTSLVSFQQDLLTNLDLTFNRPIKTWDSSKITLTDTTNKIIPNVFSFLDSTKKIITLKTPWTEETTYRLLIIKEAVTDTLNNLLSKSDTIRFKSKSKSDYGSLLLRFSNLDTAQHIVVQFLKNEEVVKSVVIAASSWSDKLMEPGEYELRILYDSNRNGIWDPGNYSKKLQPEKAITLDKKLTIKANWDNERDIKL